MHLARKGRLVVGHSGYGKGVYTGQVIADEDRVLISNPFPYKDEFHATRLHTLEQLVAFFKTKPAKFRVTFTPRICSRKCCKGKRSEYVHVVQLAWAVKNLMFVTDEIAASRHLPRNMPIPMQVVDMAIMGRHREVSTIITAQRPYYLPIEIRAESDELVVFNLTEERDRDWVSGYPGAAGYEDEIANLPRLHYLKFTKEPREVVRGRLEFDGSKADDVPAVRRDGDPEGGAAGVGGAEHPQAGAVGRADGGADDAPVSGLRNNALPESL